DRVAALADVVAAGEDGDAAGALDLELDPGLRHRVRVDRVVRARDVHRSGDAQPAPARELAAALTPSARALDFVEAAQEAVRRDPLSVDRRRVLALEVLPADLDRVEAELLRDLVELHLERESRLHRSVPALRTAGRLVREHARAVEAVAREVVRPGQELPGVV